MNVFGINLQEAQAHNPRIEKRGGQFCAEPKQPLYSSENISGLNWGNSIPDQGTAVKHVKVAPDPVLNPTDPVTNRL